MSTLEPGASRPIVRSQPPTRRLSVQLGSWSARTQAMFGIDLRQFRKSPLGDLVDRWMHTVVVGCGNGIVEQIDSVLVVMGRPSQHSPIYVLSGPSRRKVERCAGRASVWLDDATLVLAPDLDQAALEEATRGNERTNPRVMAAVSHIDTGAAMWAVGAGSPGEDGWSDTFREMRATIAIDDGLLAASFKLDFPTAEKAASAAAAFESAVEQMPPFAAYMEGATARHDGSWLLIEISMTRDVLASVGRDPMFAQLFPSPPNSNLAPADDEPYSKH